MCLQGLVNLDILQRKVDLRQPDDKVPQTTSISVYFVIAICKWIGHYTILHYATQKKTQ